jgi:serine phosphatase RsbU (regulator of sigma subunit)
VLPRRREPDLADLAAFTLDPGGRVVSWSVTATALFSRPPHAAIGRNGSFQVTQFSLTPGATLALYTDGLVESRIRPIDDGLAALRSALSSALAEPGSTLDGACQTVTQLLCEHGEDDITLMLARTRQ